MVDGMAKKKKIQKYKRQLLKARKKQHDNQHEDYYVFNMHGYLFSLKNKNSHYEVPALIDLLYSDSRKGLTIDEICKRNWMFPDELETYASNYPDLQTALTRCKRWSYASAIELLRAASKDKTSHSAPMMKLLMESIYQITNEDDTKKNESSVEETLKELADRLPG